MIGTPWNTTVPNCIVDGIPTLRCIPAVFQNLLVAGIVFSGIVAIFFIIWAGIKIIRSNGDVKQVDSAKKTITYVVIGLVIIFLSFLILNVISVITGVTCIQNFGFTNCQ